MLMNRDKRPCVGAPRSRPPTAARHRAASLMKSLQNASENTIATATPDTRESHPKIDDAAVIRQNSPAERYRATPATVRCARTPPAVVGWCTETALIIGRCDGLTLPPTRPARLQTGPCPWITQGPTTAIDVKVPPRITPLPQITPTTATARQRRPVISPPDDGAACKIRVGISAISDFAAAMGLLAAISVPRC